MENRSLVLDLIRSLLDMIEAGTRSVTFMWPSVEAPTRLTSWNNTNSKVFFDHMALRLIVYQTLSISQ
jgi:hypothetical protein